MSARARAVAAAVSRKATMAAVQIPRTVQRRAAAPGYAAAPPVLVNSVPKSGTHLLHAVAACLPGMRDYHSFVASVPSVVHRPRSPAAVAARLDRIAPGELVRAHLWHSAETAARLRRLHAVHLFIVRDPRDVVVSEAHYLAAMAPWHGLHRPFAGRPDLGARVMLAIEGLEPTRTRWYPAVGPRLAPYVGWARSPTVHTVRYEELTGGGAHRVVGDVVAAYAAATGRSFDLDAVVERALAGARGSRPHTFREGGSGGWRAVFTPEHREAFKRHGGDLLVDLGYEDDDRW